MYMNRNGKILIALITIIVLLVGAIVFVVLNRYDDGPIFNPEQSQTDPTNPQYVKTSTKPWTNRALFGNLNPDTITSVHFVDEKPQGAAEQAWVFDGISCYFKEGAVYAVVGNKLKVLGAMNGAFADLTALTEISGFDLLDTSNVTDMSYLFSNCSSLTALPIQDLNTSSVVLAEAMFQGCSSLTSLDLSGMDLTNAVDMDYIFAECMSLDELYLPKTEAVMSLSHVFESVGRRSSYMTYIYGTLNTANCEDMSYMFNETRIYDYSFAQDFDTRNLKNAECMFANCGFNRIDLTQWDVSKLETTERMFYSDMIMIECNMDGWNVQSLKNCSHMFYLCTSLTDMELGWINIPDIQDASALFKECYQLQTVDVSLFKNVHFGDAREMFQYCENLITIYGESITSDVSDRMFDWCIKLVGAVEYSEFVVDGKMANTNGYFTSWATEDTDAIIAEPTSVTTEIDE